jgi:hypothetical protein
MRRLLIVSIAGTCLATSAVACIGAREVSVADVDRALAEAALSEPDLDKVRTLREQIIALNARGDQDGAIAAEAKAMTTMGHQLQQTRGGCARWVRKNR